MDEKESGHSTQAYYKLPTGYVLALENDTPLPPLCDALLEPNGLIAIGGDLSMQRLLSAYQQGIFPWSNYNPLNEDEPVMWWSPNPRMVLFPNALKISKSLKKTLKNQHFETRINTAFKAVITECSKTPRSDQNGTWISPQMISAYCNLHVHGFAMSAETWQDGKLVGGCYGVKIGRMFYGESMFHHVKDASKIAFVHLVEHLKTQHVGMIDCQMKTPLLTSFGGREINREEFMQTLTKLIE
jgi:leucyl/phenylalanyl-tRNA---protein transferase